jgi:hypothetical protein
MGLVLDSLGYTNIIRRSIRPGLEIDLEADHKALNIHLLCECKAYKNPITTRSLRDFFGNYNYEQPEANKQLKAAFFSISGYTGQAHSWYKGMAPDKKNNFEIYDLEKIEGLLVQGKLLLPEEEVDSIIRRNTDLPLGERYLLFFRSHLYLVQLIDVAGIHERFIILTAR